MNVDTDTGIVIGNPKGQGLANLRSRVHLPHNLVNAFQSSALEYGLAFVAMLVLGAPSLFLPFGRDQGEYAYLAHAALNGKVIYRDLFNVKPPLTHVIHMIALLLFGERMMAIRLMDLLWQGATAVVLAALARRLTNGRGAGVAAAIIYALSYYIVDFWNTAQTDGFMNLPLALGLLAFTATDRLRPRWLFAACGMTIGIASLFKYPIAILAPLLCFLLLVHRRRAALGPALQICLGFITPLTMTGVILAWQRALGDFVFVQLYYPAAYTLGSDGFLPYVNTTLRSLSSFYLRTPFIVLGTLTVGMDLACCDKEGNSLHRWSIALWWCAALANLVLQGKYYPYHTLPLLAPQAVAAARLTWHGRTRGQGLWPQREVAGAMAGLVLVMLLKEYLTLPYPYTHRAMFDIAAGRRTLHTNYVDAVFTPYDEGDMSVRADLEVAAYLRSHTTAQDRVFIWGFEPAIYFLAERECASRFIYNFPLYGQFDWPQLRTQLVAQLKHEAPLYIIVVTGDQMPWVTGTDLDSRAAVDRFPEFKELIVSNYQEEAVIEHFTLYRRESS